MRKERLHFPGECSLLHDLKTKYDFPLEQQRKVILFITNPADIAGNEVMEKH